MAEAAGLLESAPAPGRSGDSRARRLRAEQDLLRSLLAANPARLRDPQWRDAAVSLTLLATPALLAGPPGDQIVREHRLRIGYPLFFPSLPLDLYLDRAVVHPNIHPETGFVCLWDEHRATHTIEHALHKLAAMLAWRLANPAAPHVMQPEAWARMEDPREAGRVRKLLASDALIGVAHPHAFSTPPTVLRRRLS